MSRARWIRFSFACWLAGTVGCTAQVPDQGVLDAEPTKPGEGPAAHEDSKQEGATALGEVGVASAALSSADTYAVGVVPYNYSGSDWGTRCPNGSSLVRIYMDDEDDDNGTTYGDWVSRGTTSRTAKNASNTQLAFCKIDGTNLRPLTTDPNDTKNFYAVLQLGETCPTGSFPFSRYIDNEDDDNNNRASGPLGLNVSNSNTTLKFCFFGPAPVGVKTMSYFPELGVEYAVFHDFDGPQPNWVEHKRFARSDDEDDNNNNKTSPRDTAMFFEFEKLVGGSVNTMFDLAHVDNPVAILLPFE